MLGTVLVVFAALTISSHLVSCKAGWLLSESGGESWRYTTTLKDFFSVLKRCFTHGVLTHPPNPQSGGDGASDPGGSRGRNRGQAGALLGAACAEVCSRAAAALCRSSRLWGSIPAGLCCSRGAWCSHFLPKIQESPWKACTGYGSCWQTKDVPHFFNIFS